MRLSGTGTRIPADAVLFVAFGRVTAEKRIAQAIRGLASIVEVLPDVHLLLVGEAADDCDPLAEARALGRALGIEKLEKNVTIAGFVSDQEMGDYLAAADVCLCMRWPSSRETSASWLRCLAAGRPTVITDLVHTSDIPALDPRTWTLLHAPQPDSGQGGRKKSGPVDPVCVSIDIVDEDHSLRLAMRRLATDARLRASLGRRARRLVDGTIRARPDGHRLPERHRNGLRRAATRRRASCTLARTLSDGWDGPRDKPAPTDGAVRAAYRRDLAKIVRTLTYPYKLSRFHSE